ncbi:hypothetical protein [Mesoplasma coleopterae]|uniref:Uncharacterized protein n=1 Tax=Mesoplasma coleopterae TaxID=324078 RepID=A0A2K8P5U1_9MOLU|nr:hypothetical protein [Mesoplasma coleopterae]ATZ20955.1 hypothetical protein MCOLE_v1c04420 [Mesoplasma coleopterae]
MKKSKKILLPCGGKYNTSWLNENLIYKIRFFVTHKNIKQENDYYYMFLKDFKSDFMFEFKTKIPNWLIHEVPEKRKDPKTNGMCTWYKLYFEDYKYIQMQLNDKFDENIFYKIYNKQLKELNIDNELFISERSLEIETLDIFKWMSWISIFNFMNNDIGIDKVKFPRKIFKISLEQYSNYLENKSYIIFSDIKDENLEEFKKKDIKNCFDNIKQLRDFFSHFWNYKFSYDSDREYKAMKFYTLKNCLAIIISDSKYSDHYKVLFIDFMDILESIEEQVYSHNEFLNNSILINENY